jgi:hypothetical protein
LAFQSGERIAEMEVFNAFNAISRNVIETEPENRAPSLRGYL